MLPIVLFSLFALAQPSHCWGSLGHRTVAYLAEKHLNEEAVAYVNNLLANNRGYDISDAALFADEVKQRRPFTKQWHFIGQLFWPIKHDSTLTS